MHRQLDREGHHPKRSEAEEPLRTCGPGARIAGAKDYPPRPAFPEGVKQDSPLTLGTEDRILLYLSDFRNMEERYVMPQALSQKGIAFAAGVQRKHLSRYLDEIDRATSVHLTFSDIIREAMNVNELDLEYLEGIDDRRKRAMDERVKRLEDYTRAVMTAWKDGRVTATERLLVEQLRENLGISREEQDRIENEVLEEVLENRTGIYRAVASEALEGGPITDNERELLEALRKKLGLSSHDCREIEADLVKASA